MLQFFQNYAVALFGAGAVMFALMAIIFGLQAYFGATRQHRPVSIINRRIAITAVCAALMCACLVGCATNGDKSEADPGDTSGSIGDTSQSDPVDEPPVEPLPDVNQSLTTAQINAFLEDFDLTFDDSSLTYGVGWRRGASTMLERRKAAWKAAGSSMTDGIAFPYGEDVLGEVYDADPQKMISNIKKLSDEEQLVVFEALRHQIYQDIISNPVIGMAWLELFSQNELIMKNNAYWISPNLEILQQLYDGTYQQPKSTDPDFQEAMRIVLNNLPEPVTTDVNFRGLDYLRTYNSGRYDVRWTYASLGVRICNVLEYFDIQGITERESKIHWHLLPTAEDSMIRATMATYAESEPAIKLVYVNKDGNEAITFGSNMLDRRPMQYEPNKSEPVKVVSSDPVDPDPEDPVTPPPPTTQKTTYGLLTIRCVDDATGALLPSGANQNPYTQNVKVGGTWSWTAPVYEGYVLKDQSQSVLSSNRHGTMTAAGITITVPYVKQTTEHMVYVSYVYETGGNVYEPKSYSAKKGAEIYEIPKPCPTNYWVGPEEYRGTMGDKDVYIVFTYHYLPLEAWKDTQKDPVNQGNAEKGGGSNLPTDGKGEEQPTEPPRKDYDGTTTTTNPGSSRPDYNPQTGNSTTTITPNDTHESSGQGGDSLDHDIKDTNGGHTDNGGSAAKDPIDTTHDTTVTDTSGGGSSSSGSGDSGVTTNTSQEQVNTGTLGEPD